jgi:hypothetical protein
MRPFVLDIAEYSIERATNSVNILILKESVIGAELHFN